MVQEVQGGASAANAAIDAAAALAQREQLEAMQHAAHEKQAGLTETEPSAGGAPPRPNERPQDAHNMPDLNSMSMWDSTKFLISHEGRQLYHDVEVKVAHAIDRGVTRAEQGLENLQQRAYTHAIEHDSTGAAALSGTLEKLQLRVKHASAS